MYSRSAAKDLVAPDPQASSPRAALLRRPGDEGARRLVDALEQLTQLKELEMHFHNNHIGAGPRGVQGPWGAAEARSSARSSRSALGRCRGRCWLFAASEQLQEAFGSLVPSALRWRGVDLMGSKHCGPPKPL